MHVESVVEQHYLCIALGGGAYKYIARVRVSVDKTSHKQLMAKC